MRQYARVTYDDRCHISAWLQDNISMGEMAKRLGFHKSTLSREIRRNSSTRGYRASSAQQKARTRYRDCRRHYVLKSELKNWILKQLKEQWSPQQISERLKREGKLSVSHECIYQYIRKNRNHFLKDLRRMRQRRGAGRYRQKGTHIHSFQPNISKRPSAANKRSRMGHLERDIMFAGDKTPILVCVDRKSRLIRLKRTKDLKAETVNQQTLEILQQLPFKARTVTSDRGTEFKVPLKELKTFYCDPQAPQQRGSVENAIGLVRQYIPRRFDPKKLTIGLLKTIEDKLNHRPRRVLDYRTPYEVATNQSVALAS